MRPLLKTGLRRMRRPGGSLQVGVTPGRSLMLGGLSAADERFVGSLDGCRDIPELLAHAARLGVAGGQAATLLDVLARAGFLDDADYDPGPLRALDVAERERLRPDLAALALGYLVPGGGVRALGRRRSAVVAVHGCGRVGASVAHLLAAAGVGCVVPVDAAVAREWDAAPAGYGAGAVDPFPGGDAGWFGGLALAPREAVGTGRQTGRDQDAAGAAVPAAGVPAPREPVRPRRQDLVRDLIRATAPTTRTTLPANRQQPDLAVLAPTGDAHPALAAALHTAGVPHLLAEVHETTGVLGPFVQPGRTPCLACRDLYRTDADPGWPGQLAPFAGVDAAPDRGGERACDVVLATQVATLAVMHALSFIEGDPPVSAGAEIEVRLPDGGQVRRERPAHPECGCGAAAAAAAGRLSPRLPGAFGQSSPPRGF